MPLFLWADRHKEGADRHGPGGADRRTRARRPARPRRATSPSARPLAGSAFPRSVDNAYRPPTAFAMIPPVVKNLLIINTLVFIALQIPSISGVLDVYGMLWPAGTPAAIPQADGLAAVPQFYPWQLLTSGFMHHGFGHFLFNMIGLWLFGMRIESVLGSRRFLIFFLACVVGGSLVQLVAVSWPWWAGATGLIVPTLGASGGVLGVAVAFAMFYPDEPIYLYFVLRVPAKWLVLGFAVFGVFAGITGVQGGVAHWAHLGGMLVGALMILYWRRRALLVRRSA